MFDSAGSSALCKTWNGMDCIGMEPLLELFNRFFFFRDLFVIC